MGSSRSDGFTEPSTLPHPARLSVTLTPDAPLASRSCLGPLDTGQVSNLVRCHRTPKERVHRGLKGKALNREV